MAGANHDEHALCTSILRLLAQACGHVSVAFTDQRIEQRRRLSRKFVEHAAQQVALLEFLDLVLADLVPGEEARAETADDREAIEEADASVGALERHADLAIDQPDRKTARIGSVDCSFHLRTGLD